MLGLETSNSNAKAKQTAEELREQLDASPARELSLLAELYRVKKTLAKQGVLPIRGAPQKITLVNAKLRYIVGF